jgi:hypothetical protein
MSEEEEKKLLENSSDTEEEQTSFKEEFFEFFSWVTYYYSSKNVRILDRRLGYIYYGTLTVILLYLIVVVFLINKSYLDIEKVEGFTYTELLGTAYSTGSNPYVWDVAEENPWGHETSAVFIPSKVVVTKAQYQGVCADPYLYCESDADCATNDLPNVIETETCSKSAAGTYGCEAWRWCPPESNSSEIYYLENAAHQIVWARFKVEFQRLASLSKDNLGDEDFKRYPGEDSDAWEVSDIIQMAGTNFSQIADKGALFKATLVLNCIRNPNEKCDMSLQVERLDKADSGGYSMQHAEYYRRSGQLYRDLYHFKGVRILFSTYGIYITPSLFNIVLQIASSLGLIIATNAITDAIMLNILKEKTHFKQLKIKESEDLND